MFPGVAGRVRELHCVQTETRKTSIWDLRSLKHLSKIRLDWHPRSMLLPRYTDRADRLPFAHVASSVIELEVRGLPWPSPLTFCNIHHIFPDLNVLRLQQERIWCGLCHTCSVARFRSPGPGKIVYEAGVGLPMHYAQTFSALQRLHTVFITIPDFGGGSTTLKEGGEFNKYLWAGECDRCMEVMYEDDAFRDSWVARKKGLSCTDKDSAKAVYVPPPALKRVEWRVWNAEGSEELDVQESEDEFSVSGEES
ncbi:hypothetical protein LshimejAT787_0901910 [Lyophyllum shimeji]|uniref:Uncharacterized protein n=1 Tax=Lyophyllum shimeji TaxID=47721 RepID=A0A9P3US99_LYOSH|nr:hypothetical protein LshimejAT787_0901910 [Lyophyllum shimeji]